MSKLSSHLLELRNLSAIILHAASLEDYRRLAAMSTAPFPNLRQSTAAQWDEVLSLGQKQGVLQHDSAVIINTDKECEELARKTLMGEKGGSLASAVSKALPSLPNVGASSLERALRDIRNSFYSGDVPLFKRMVNHFNLHFAEHYPDTFILQFMMPQLDAPWLAEAGPSRLAICAWQLFPQAILLLQPAETLFNALTPMLRVLPPASLFPIIDYLILRGKLKQAEALLAQTDNDAKQLRKAWLLFLKGKDNEAMTTFIDALYSIRHDTFSDFYFQTVGGLFLVLAQIKENTEASLTAAEANAISGNHIAAFRHAYLALYRYIEQRLNHTLQRPMNPGTREHSPLCRFFELFPQYWCPGENPAELRQRALELKAQAEEGGYSWIADQCGALAQRLDANWTGDITGAGQPLVLADCVRVEPPWRRTLGQLNEFLSEPVQNTGCRLAWFLSHQSQGSGAITLKPLEQRQTKTGRWGKGRVFPLMKAGATESWPPYLTPQDIWVCSLLYRHARAKGQVVDDTLIQTFTDNEALGGLVNHPLVFWDKEPAPRIRCENQVPYLTLTVQEGCYCLAMTPECPVQGNITPMKADDTLLKLFVFDDRCKRLASLLNGNLIFPQEAMPTMQPCLASLCTSFSLLADTPLDFLQIPAIHANEKPIFRLTPTEQGLQVELAFQPFPGFQTLFQPGSGPCEWIRHDGRDGARRHIRDIDRELAIAEELVEICTMLPSSENRVWNWKLSTPAAAYDFVLQLQELGDRCFVQWPEGGKIKVSNPLTLHDLSIRTQRQNDWFSISGDVTVNEDLTLTLSELLRAMKKSRGNYILLNDGQVISLAESFRKRLQNLEMLGEMEGDTLRLPQFALFAAEPVMDGIRNLSRTGDWEEQLKRIHNAMELDPKVPSGFTATLRAYQMEGFLWLNRLDAMGAGACLADDMGLGKTVQTIAFLLAKASEGPALVIAPTSVCHNWKLELQHFAPSLQALLFGEGNRKQQLDTIGPGQVMISSYGLLQSEIRAFQKVHWRIAVLDEAQAIKNYQAKRSQAALSINADFHMVTTGTPVENNLNELWVIFHFINPGLLGTREDFQHRFVIPIERNNDKAATERLNSLLRPFLLRRSKEQVLTELPPKTEISLFVELSDEERAFYEALRRNLVEELHGTEGNQLQDVTQMRFKVLTAITKLRMCACNPCLVKEDSKIHSTKLAMFEHLLDELLKSGHKSLVFSQFVRHLNLIRQMLDSRGIPYQYLDGNTSPKDRLTAVESFQKGQGSIFLISLRAGGLGLNLTEADYVIHLDPWWNPAVEDQASDRAHRLGQTKPVTIYRLIAKDTIEAKILNLHQAKRNLADQLLAGSDAPSSLSPEELIRLLTEP